MPTERISWIDNLRFVAIAFVAFGHTYVLAPAGVVRYVYTFHLAVFWFLSGMLRKADEPLRPGITKAFRRLVVPFFFLGSLVFAYRVGVAALVSLHRVVDSRPGPLVPLITIVHALPGLYWRLLLNLDTQMTTPLWFLAGLFLVTVLVLLAERRRSLHVVLVVVAVAFGVRSKDPALVAQIRPELLRFWLAWFGFSIPVGLLVYSVGFWSRSWVWAHLGWIKKGALALLVVDLVAFFLFPGSSLLGNLVLAFLGIAAWFGIAHYLPSWSPALYLGRASLVVLGLHEVFFDVTYRANRALTALFGVPPFFTHRSHNFWMQLAAGVSLTVIALLLCVPTIWVLERYALWGLGGRRSGAKAQVEPVAPAIGEPMAEVGA